MLLILKVEKLIAQTCFENNFQNPEYEWKDIYIHALPRRVRINAILRIFQYKLLFDILTKHCTDLEIRDPHFALFT